MAEITESSRGWNQAITGQLNGFVKLVPGAVLQKIAGTEAGTVIGPKATPTIRQDGTVGDMRLSEPIRTSEEVILYCNGSAVHRCLWVTDKPGGIQEDANRNNLTETVWIVACDWKGAVRKSYLDPNSEIGGWYYIRLCDIWEATP